MANGETTVQLSVGLDASDVKKSASELKKDIEDVFSQTKGKTVSAELEKIQSNMDKAASRAEALRTKMEELENTKVPTQEYSKLETQYNKLNQQLDMLAGKEREMRAQGATFGATWQKNQTAINNVQNAIKSVSSSMSELVSEGKAFTLGSDTSQYANLKNQLNGVLNTERLLYEAALNTGEVQARSARLTGDVWQRTGQMIKNTFKDIKSGAIFKDLAKTGVNTAKKIGSAFAQLPGKMDGFIKKLKESKSSMNNLGNSAGKLVKKILLLGFGIRGAVGLFRKLRSAISDGLKAMAMWNGGNNAVNSSISMLMSSLNYLKASWGAAFAPILSVVAPILSAFMDMLAKAAQMVGAFFAALTGKSTYTGVSKKSANYAGGAGGKSSSGSKNEDKQKKAQEKYEKQVAKVREKNSKAQAKAEEKQAKAADKLAKKQEKANDKLADFDDLNVLGIEHMEELENIEPEVYEEPQFEAPDLSGGGAGGGLPIAGFDEKQIPEWVQNLVDKIKEAWKNADFTEIGRMVGEKMRDALNTASNWLVNVAQPFATKLGKSIATFLNGFFETPGLATALGRAIGELINTALNFATAFVENFHWDSFGKFIGEGLSSALKTINWVQLGHTLALGISGLFETMKNAWLSVDWKGIGNLVGQGIQQFINDIDLSQLTGLISAKVIGVYKFLTGLLQGIKWFELAKTIVDKIVEAVKGFDVSGMASAMAEFMGSAIGAVGAFVAGLSVKIYELVKSAWDGAKSYINSYIKEAGGDVIKGFFNGMLDLLKDIGQWVYEHLFKPFMDGIRSTFQIGSPSKVMEEVGRFLMEGLFNGMIALMQKVIDVIVRLKDGIIIKWNEFKSRFESITTTIKTNIEKIWTGLKTNIEKLTTNLKENTQKIIQQLREKVEDIVDTLKRNFITFFNNIWTEVTKIAGNIRDDVVGVIQALHDKTVGPNGWVAQIKQKFIAAWTEIEKGIKTPIDGIKSLIEGIADTAKSVVNAVIDTLNKFNIEMPDWEILPESIRGKKWSPNIQKLAQGAVIPPNKEFLAVLGDQKQGTNIETPLATMVDAFKIALQDMPTPQTSNQNAIMTLDGQTFARLVVPYVMDELGRRGYNTTILEG